MDKEDKSPNSGDFSTLSGINSSDDKLGHLIDKLTERSSLIGFVGLLSGEEAYSVERAILKLRKMNKERAFTLGKELINNDR